MNTEDRTKIKERIAALLAKANCSTVTEGESQLYFTKAAELMEKHQIELFELGTEDPIGATTGCLYSSGVARAKADVQQALCRYYGGRPVITWVPGVGKCIELCGPESTRVTTELMTEFVWGQVRAKAKVYAAERGQNIQTATRNIAKGLVHRIHMELAEQRAREAATPAPAGTSRSLVVVDAVAAYLANRYPEMKKLKGGPKKVLQSAFDHAKGISLHRQVNTANTKRLN